MPRTRIVLETSDKRKSAMIEAADLQGATLVDWFEEQVSTAIPRLSKDDAEIPIEVANVVDLEDSKSIVKSLSSRDWSFTDDDTRYLTHDLHPYPAKFIPQIPAHLIAQLSMPGDLIADPFGGSATTAVEAVRLGRRAVSMDANPLSALIGRVKTGFMADDVRTDLEQLCAAIEGHIIELKTEGAERSEDLVGRYGRYRPDIPNIEKWFSPHATGELCVICHLIDETTEGLARDAALLALSRIIVRVSNQESETRYVSVEQELDPTLTLRAYLESIKTVARRLENAAHALQFADARFVVADSRFDLPSQVGDSSVELIVTSPPYPNATDYHLYHRFRLFWLGFDPKALGKIEIGSHLRHQRNHTGFEEYRADMARAMEGCFDVLMPSRYAVFIVGDAIFKGETFSTSDAICDAAQEAGFDVLKVIDRDIHKTKRSFAKPARRARSEQLVVLQKPNRSVMVTLNPPGYRMWEYEEELRAREIESLTHEKVASSRATKPIALELKQPSLWNLRRLTFTRNVDVGDKTGQALPTWQNVLENGDADPAKRKDPKYATHGLHPFKGKFYPQLAKSLINISEVQVGARILDPFCGSGTALLEGMLNGFETYGCDLNPLSARIARSKTATLTVPREVVDLSIRAMLDRVSNKRGKISDKLEQFEDGTHKELLNWFPEPVLNKLNWLLGQIRLLGNQTLVGFFEVIVSSLIREVSDQDPTDLRIRRRKEPLDDAPVLEMFCERLEVQYKRLRKYWLVAGRQPGRLIPPVIVEGDSRNAGTYKSLNLGTNSVDSVITSPPFATALPYIDTDRLSLLALLGIGTRARSELEDNLTGSREIRRRAKDGAEANLFDRHAAKELPVAVVNAIRAIHKANQSADVGFRRANMPALLWRYFLDMKANLNQVLDILKPNARAFYVVGDSRTKAGGDWVPIETCKNIKLIGEMVGLHCVDKIDIRVTTENYNHIKNAITKNEVIIFQKI